MMRLPPTSARFPYTTLFRSEEEGDRARDLGGEAAHRADLRDALTHRLHDAPAPEQRAEADRHVAGDHHPARHALARDRKSTRLNSSHMSSSYAVFCLTKKRR